MRTRPLIGHWPGRLLACGALCSVAVVSGLVVSSQDVQASSQQPCTDQFDAEEPSQLEGVYQVSKPAHLSWMFETALDGKFTVLPALTSDFQQTADINLEGCLWTPLDGMASAPVIANKTTDTAAADPVYGFTGSYDGGGFSLSGLTIDVASLTSVTQDEDPGNEYELFDKIGFIGYLNGGQLRNLTLEQPQLNFTLGNINRAELNSVGLAVGSAQGAAIENIRVNGGTIAINCEVDNPSSALCDVTAVGGVVGATVSSPSSLSSLSASVTISAASKDAPVDNNLEDPIILQLAPGGIGLTSVGAIIGADTAGSSLSSLSAEGSMALDFPRVSQLGGVAGTLSGSALTRSSSDVRMTLTHPQLLPSADLSGGFQRIGGLVGFMINDATITQSRSHSVVTAQLEVFQVNGDLSDPDGRCSDTSVDPAQRWVDGIETWENSDRNRACNPVQAIAEIGGLVGVIFDPSTSGPGIASSINRTEIALTVADSTVVTNVSPELIIGSIGSAIGSVFQDEHDEPYTVMSRSYAAGSLALSIADSLQSNEGVLVSRGLNDLAQPGSLIGSWNPDEHTVDSDVVVADTGYTSATTRGGTILPATQMTTTAPYLERGWPIVTGFAAFEQNVAEWGLCAGVNDGYPFGLWEYSSTPCPASSSPTTATSSSRDDDQSDTPIDIATGPAPSAVPTTAAADDTLSQEGELGDTQAMPGPNAQTEAFPSEQTPERDSSPTAPEDSAGISVWPLALAALAGLGVLGIAAAAWAIFGTRASSGSGLFRSR